MRSALTMSECGIFDMGSKRQFSWEYFEWNTNRKEIFKTANAQQTLISSAKGWYFIVRLPASLTFEKQVGWGT